MGKRWDDASVIQEVDKILVNLHCRLHGSDWLVDMLLPPPSFFIISASKSMTILMQQQASN